MNERTKTRTKIPESKSNDAASKTQKLNLSSSLPVDQIIFLQRTIGNQAVQALFKTGIIQAKLRVGKPDDIYEQEADCVAEQVMRKPEPETRSKSAWAFDAPSCGEEEPVQTRALSEQITPLALRLEEENQSRSIIQRKAEEDEEETLQTKDIAGKTHDVTTDLEKNIQLLRGGGEPLPEFIRSYFEPRFGHDFSKVRVHTDAPANSLNMALQARAFTAGKDIFFKRGAYEPSRKKGQGLIAHELTHVLQQGERIHHVQREQRRPPEIYSTPYPRQARRAPGGGVSFSIGQIQVTMLPDGRIQDQNLAGDAITRLTPQSLSIDTEDTADGQVRLLRPVGPLRITLQTLYGPGTTRTSPASYGRGTTLQDIRDGNTTLGFHESCHGRDLMDYMRRNQPPRPPAVFQAIGVMSMLAFSAAFGQYRSELDRYLDASSRYTILRTDCVGRTIDQVRGTRHCTGQAGTSP